MNKKEMKRLLKIGCKECDAKKVDFKVVKITKKQVIVTYECRDCLANFGKVNYYA